MVDIKVNPQYSGPTILELDAVIGDVQGTVEVRWQGSKAEFAVLRRHRDRTFVLYVQDLPAMERASTFLGIPLTFDTAFLTVANTSLTSRKSYNWRAFSEGIGVNMSRSLLTRLSAGAIRQGRAPRLAKIASECIIEGINPIDADVLLRLRVLNED